MWFAHSSPDASHGDWEPLEDHLRLVAGGAAPAPMPGAREYASAFGAGCWGELAGLWHDLGKYSAEFQQYLRDSVGGGAGDGGRPLRGSVDHSTFGAQHAMAGGPTGALLAYPIAGHHGGLPDWRDLQARLSKAVPRAVPPAAIAKRPLPPPPQFGECPMNSERGFRVAFWVRMLFSALVDADFLATESFLSPGQREDRGRATPPPLTVLSASLDGTLNTLADRAPDSDVNRRRAGVLAACREAAADSAGFFSLTVPTGGGKTYASLAFALRHAAANDLRRVIYAVPFTSIIEQNARVFRSALRGAGPHGVLEHHSSFEALDEEDRWARLAAENWDSPLVVTTTVQLYESLFHNKPSRCRKLHNIANSVIVLDEAQAIPVNLLSPTLAALRELVRAYGCTVLLCTATQPALTRREGFHIGLPKPREIVPDVPALFDAMRRTRVEPVRSLGDEELAGELAEQRQVLCIVHTKRQARAVFESMCDRLGEPSDVPLTERECFHLTTNMCAAHRLFVIRLIRRRLGRGLPCRVVSTSLIEAGVDVDFPVVYRAVAGLDSIAQAAGRCNREGKLPCGRVVVFETKEPPPVYASESIRDARLVLQRHGDDPLSPAAIEAYFSEHYWQHSERWDRGARDSSGDRGLPVLECFSGQPQREPPHLLLNFRTAAERYRLIEDEQTPVLVPWGARGRELIAEARRFRFPPDAEFRRRCQRFAVGVRAGALWDMLETGAVSQASEFAQDLCCLNAELTDGYSAVLGLIPSPRLRPEWLIQGGI
ncbi:MAG: CRISPR-associated endonuclease Cas3'' [Phycisphaerales bacterium]|nr:CRISPR-associated endonuclease Cas3'' [Phycisphaerales bacterium]